MDQISEIVESAVGNLSRVAEVNTIIGKPIVTSEGTTILPVSEVTFAFMAGGGEYGDKKAPKSIVREGFSNKFAGASGGGASLTPVGFLVIDKNGVRMINTPEESSAGKILDIAKEILKNVKN